MAKGRRRRPPKDTVVTTVITKLGGPTVAIAKLSRPVGTTTLWRWCKAGRVSDPELALELAALLHPRSSDRQLKLFRKLVERSAA